MRRLRVKLRPIVLWGLLSALPLAPAGAKNVKPDPDGLPPHDVKDLHYGDVLFYFYQDDYFDAITRLLAAQQLDRLPHTEGEAELLLGGLYLSLGEHVEAGKIFEALLAGKTSERVRNKAWFYLGKVWYQRGYLQESERALNQVSGNIQPRISAERYMLLAQLMLREGRYDDAIAALSAWHGAPDWTAYAQYNLGVALVRKGRLPDAVGYLDRVGKMDTADEELLSLRDKANLALGFAFLQAQRPADAKPILERVRLEGPFSSMALLGDGWADSSLGQFKKALVPWTALRKRNLLDAAVQEAYLTVPYAYNQLGAHGQAAEYYSSAIDSFDAEQKRIDESIVEIRSGNLLDRLLNDDKKDTLTWYWQLKTLPDAPESRYLYHLLATNEFQEGLKNYRELKFMSKNLDDWREDLSAFDSMLDTRQKAYGEEVPKADAIMAATDLDALTQKRVEFESRLNAIEKSNDVAALGTQDEQRTWARLKRIEDYLAMHPGDPDLAEMRERLRLMKGVMYWRLSESFKARLWNERRSVKELEASLIETQKRAVLVKQARTGMPANTGAFADRVQATRARMDDLQQRLAALTDKQSRYLQDIAIEELGRQKQRIETYEVQARFELAAIYDKATNPEDKPRDDKAPHDPSGGQP
ncbi:MAG TPA: tetratricopeptide repeat protein [Steroidobacteraceae bacterium]|nr:tetratricopeptide repeat protein [Steroidobacteraceae bacterium]